MRPATPTNSKGWDEARREARRLEVDLESKLSQYGRLANSYQYGAKGETGLNADQASSAKEAAIEDLLQRLEDLNEKMGGIVGGSGDPRLHTLTRHRDVVHDLQQEYRRLQENFGAARERADLFAGTNSDSLRNGQGATALLLRERTGIQSSNAALDDVIGQANAVANNLSQQRSVFETVAGKLVNVSSRFPAVNSVMNAIRRKKNKDTLVLAGVITVCSLFILIYWLRK